MVVRGPIRRRDLIPHTNFISERLVSMARQTFASQAFAPSPSCELSSLASTRPPTCFSLAQGGVGGSSAWLSGSFISLGFPSYFLFFLLLISFCQFKYQSIQRTFRGEGNSFPPIQKQYLRSQLSDQIWGPRCSWRIKAGDLGYIAWVENFMYIIWRLEFVPGQFNIWLNKLKKEKRPQL